MCAGGCSFSVAPSYTKNDLEKVVKDLIKKGCGIEATTKLVGSTFWVYLPLEDITEFPPHPPSFYERFEPVEANAG
ncbi:MAG: hypothetical protein PHT59_01145, partial [Candidatus Omnitrophica bacterium]|nr:hypothetical protein [Candidatus Omnitrophota bacterium]